MQLRIRPAGGLLVQLILFRHRIPGEMKNTVRTCTVKRERVFVMFSSAGVVRYFLGAPSAPSDFCRTDRLLPRECNREWLSFYSLETY